jgi:hypothetical protein
LKAVFIGWFPSQLKNLDHLILAKAVHLPGKPVWFFPDGQGSPFGNSIEITDRFKLGSERFCLFSGTEGPYSLDRKFKRGLLRSNSDHVRFFDPGFFIDWNNRPCFNDLFFRRPEDHSVTTGPGAAP